MEAPPFGYANAPSPCTSNRQPIVACVLLDVDLLCNEKHTKKNFSSYTKGSYWKRFLCVKILGQGLCKATLLRMLLPMRSVFRTNKRTHLVYIYDILRRIIQPAVVDNISHSSVSVNKTPLSLRPRAHANNKPYYHNALGPPSPIHDA